MVLRNVEKLFVIKNAVFVDDKFPSAREIAKLSFHKLIHSGKKIDFMKEEISTFLDKVTNNMAIIEQLCNLKNISNISLKEIA